MRSKNVLVVGAGPTGLATAMFLTELKHKVRIIDRLSEPAGYSKAMAVNPRSLTLLEKSGVTETLHDQGQKIRFIKLGTEDRALAALDLGMSGHKYGYMIGLPQSETERILTHRLESLGLQVERGTELKDFTQGEDSVECELVTKYGKIENFVADYLVGANGAKSNVRKKLGADFEGDTLPGDWHMADVKLTSTSSLKERLTEDGLHMTFMDKGFLFGVSFKPGIFRIATNYPSVYDCLPDASEIESVEWESMFSINHRLTSFYAQGRVALAGDAAHVHSPIGGRGMNLDIEDAANLAKAIDSGNLEKYNQTRLEAARGVLKIVDLQTKMALGEKAIYRFIRRFVMPLAISRPFIHKRLVRRFTGLNATVE